MSFDRESFDAATTPDLPEELRPDTDREEEEAEERYFEERRGSKRFRAWSSSVFIDPILLLIVSAGWVWGKITSALGGGRARRPEGRRRCASSSSPTIRTRA